MWIESKCLFLNEFLNKPILVKNWKKKRLPKTLTEILFSESYSELYKNVYRSI